MGDNLPPPLGFDKSIPRTWPKTMPELKLKREGLGWLRAARSGHGHFADYHEKFGHEGADKQCRWRAKTFAPPPQFLMSHCALP